MYELSIECLKHINTVEFWQYYIDLVPQLKDRADDVRDYFVRMTKEFISFFPKGSDVKNKIIEFKNLLDEENINQT